MTLLRTLADVTSAATSRKPAPVLNIVGTWPDPADSDANVEWVRRHVTCPSTKESFG